MIHHVQEVSQDAPWSAVEFNEWLAKFNMPEHELNPKLPLWLCYLVPRCESGPKVGTTQQLALALKLVQYTQRAAILFHRRFIIQRANEHTRRGK